jgi:hypothetical protein
VFASDFTVGAGLGSQYSGLGFNAGLQKGESLFLISFGITAMGAIEDSGLATVYGVGASWFSTGAIPQEGDRHALGVYAGAIGGRIKFLNNEVIEKRSLYGGGFSYSYFLNGLSNSGWNLGLFLGACTEDDEWRGVAAPVVGYQLHY